MVLLKFLKPSGCSCPRSLVPSYVHPWMEPTAVVIKFEDIIVMERGFIFEWFHFQ